MSSWRRVPRGCSQVKGCHLVRCGCQGNKNFAQLSLSLSPLFWLLPLPKSNYCFPPASLVLIQVKIQTNVIYVLLYMYIQYLLFVCLCMYNINMQSDKQTLCHTFGSGNKMIFMTNALQLRIICSVSPRLSLHKSSKRLRYCSPILALANYSGQLKKL